MKTLRCSLSAFVAAMLLLLVASSCRPTNPVAPKPDPDSCCNASITVHVSSGANSAGTVGAPVGGTSVSLSGSNGVSRSGQTDKDGNVTFDKLCPGEYTIVTKVQTSTGVVTKETKVTLGCNQVVKVPLVLPPAPPPPPPPPPPKPNPDSCCHASITLHVLDTSVSPQNSNGMPVAGALVTLYDANGVAHTVVTDEKGNVTFKDLCPGQYTVGINGKSAAGTPIMTKFLVKVDCNQTVNETVLVSSGTVNHTSLIMGKVVKGPISPISVPGQTNEGALSGAVVIVTDGKGATIATVTSDANGAFTLPTAAGTYTLTPQPLPNAILPRPDGSLTVQVATGASVSVTLHYDTGIR